MGTFFLDFDRTLFDTSAFLAYIVQRDILTELEMLSEVEKAVALNKKVSDGTLVFQEGELTHFLFPDAQEFLAAHGGECVVVTAGNEHLQKAKCANALAAYENLKIFYTGEERKGPFIAKIENDFPKPWTFVDDKPMELESVGTAHPETNLYQMCRNGLEPAGKYPVLLSFADLA
jgi:hypothetical protein